MKIFLKYTALALEGCFYLILLGLFFVTFSYGLTYHYLLLMTVILIFLISARLLLFKFLKPETSPKRRRLNLISQGLFWAILSCSLLFPVIPEQLLEEYMSVFIWISSFCILGLLGGLIICRYTVPVYAQFYFFSVTLVLSWQVFKVFTNWSHVEAVSIASPFNDEWFVVQGGSSVLINHHYHVEAQRYSIDLVETSDLPSGLSSNSYASFGSEIYSPTRGQVISVVSDREDDGLITGDSKTSVFGNYIIIQQEGHERYVVLAHLMKNSVLVEEGAFVEVGDLIAKCGNSGNSSQPHLHLQIQSSPHLMGEETITFPVVFERTKTAVGLVSSLEGRPARRGDKISRHD